MGRTAACSAAKRWAPLNGERSSTFCHAYQKPTRRANRLPEMQWLLRRGFCPATELGLSRRQPSFFPSFLSSRYPAHPRSGEVLERTLGRGDREGGGQKKKLK